MTDKSDVVKMIDDLVAEKTFSLDATTAIQSLKKRAEADALDLMNVSIQLKNANKKIEDLLSDNSAMRQRETLVAEREKKAIDLEKTVACEIVRASTYKDMFDRMFANRIVRESNMVNQYVSTPNGPVMMPNNSTVTKEEA